MLRIKPWLALTLVVLFAAAAGGGDPVLSPRLSRQPTRATTGSFPDSIALSSRWAALNRLKDWAILTGDVRSLEYLERLEAELIAAEAAQLPLAVGLDSRIPPGRRVAPPLAEEGRFSQRALTVQASGPWAPFDHTDTPSRGTTVSATATIPVWNWGVFDVEAGWSDADLFDPWARPSETGAFWRGAVRWRW